MIDKIKRLRRAPTGKSVARIAPPPLNVCQLPVVEVKPTGQPVRFLDAKPFHCRAILGDARDVPVMLCGDPRRPNSSWCAAHHQLFHLPPRELAKET